MRYTPCMPAQPAHLQPAGQGGINRRHAAAHVNDHVVCRYNSLLQVDVAGPDTIDDGEAGESQRKRGGGGGVVQLQNPAQNLKQGGCSRQMQQEAGTVSKALFSGQSG